MKILAIRANGPTEFALTLEGESDPVNVPSSSLWVIPANPEFECKPPKPDQQVCTEGYYYLEGTIVSPAIFEFIRSSLS